MKRIFLALVLAFSLTLNICAPAAWADAAKDEERVLVISDSKQLRQLAVDCTLVEYSQGLTVKLDKDIDLDGRPMQAIPSFSGVFDGQGHSIKNFVLDCNGFSQGLFRFLNEGAVIKRLKVEGIVDGGHRMDKIGGIVGSNYGSIEDCSFSGKVTGLNYVGGIAGTSSGSISGCQSQGEISGKRFTGGIAGESSGAVVSCKNQAQVNTGISPGGIVVDELNIDNMSLTGAEDTDVVSDSGGIVGFSKGLILDCVNTAEVGYPHYGYNVGGIAGRQSGHIANCENRGFIQGRKDLGGIVGQMEPNKQLINRASLADEIRRLQSMISSAMANAGAMSQQMQAALGNIALGAGQTLEDLLFPNGRPDISPPDPETPIDPSEPIIPPGQEPQPESDVQEESGAEEAQAVPGEALSARNSGSVVLLSSIEPEEDVGGGYDLSDKWPDLKPDFSPDTEGLKDDLDQMAQDMLYFDQLLNASSDNIKNSFSALGDQLGRVLLMMANAVSGEDIELFQDVSSKEPEDSTLGRVRDCTNRGSVEGDSNVGGIAGDMGIEYEFDMENQLLNAVKASNVVSSTYKTRCIISGCRSYGQIKAKKDNAGGIAGQSQVGLVEQSESYANVKSVEGSFVGGISGRSYSLIRDCYAMGRISGRRYVGGIAGRATDLYSCASLVALRDVEANAGGIAGWANMAESEIHDCYSVDPSQGAIDGLSYQDKAQGIEYEELLKLEGLPEDFGQLKLSFVADGRVVAERPFCYGGSIDSQKLPAVPKKQGYSGEWEEYDYSELYYSDIIEAEYSYSHGTLAAEDPRGGSERSMVLVEGDFDQAASLELKAFQGDGPQLAQGKVLEMWSLNVDQPGKAESFTLRYLMPELSQRDSKLELYLYSNGTWTQQKTSRSGSYMLMDVEGSSAVFAAVEAPDQMSYLEMALVGLAITTAVVVVSVIVIRKKKSKDRA